MSMRLGEVLCSWAVCLLLLPTVNSVLWVFSKRWISDTFNCSQLHYKKGDLYLLVQLRWGKTPEEKYAAALPFLVAIDTINKDKTLLENITLGYYILDASMHWKQAMLFSLHYTDHKFSDEYCPHGDPAHPPWFEVEGVIVVAYSRESMHHSYISQISSIPFFTSAEATSDELSDNSRHPTFFRTVSGDSKQVGVQ